MITSVVDTAVTGVFNTRSPRVRVLCSASVWLVATDSQRHLCIEADHEVELVGTIHVRVRVEAFEVNEGSLPGVVAASPFLVEVIGQVFLSFPAAPVP